MATEARPLAAARSRRVLLVVSLAALVAAAAVVGATLLQTRGDRTTVPGAVTQPRPGPPLLQLELGLRSDPEARALARAERLLDSRGQASRAAAIFRRYRSLEAQLGAAFASWRGPSSLPAVKALLAAYPDSPAALFNLGSAEYQAGRNAEAASVWEETAKRYPDTPYGVDALDALHGGPRGLPPILTGFELPNALTEQRLAALRLAAERPAAHAKLLYGVALWDLKRPLSAERQLAAAARLAPSDPVVRTAAAVARYSKANPTRAFARLGPLTAVFPHAAVVQFHLGLLLIYVDEWTKAGRHLRAAIADDPRSPYAKPARTLLASLPHTRSK
ncbi:MAG: tetratricopeptide repeat protein [Gaiellaceae bacterium]